VPIRLDEILKQDLRGKVVVFETDTVYGIGCLYDDLASIRRIYEIKNREYHKPMAILCADKEQVSSIIEQFDFIEPLARRYWPGALTLICPKKKNVDDLVTAGGKTVGVRIPDDPVALAILKKFGPMVVTSLNLSGEPPILRFTDALRYEGIVDAVVEGKDLSELASTVYDPFLKTVIRQGRIVIDE
jgi:L-threonylcarbamoyladenylate synthase